MKSSALSPSQISANPESWPQLNAVLPPARYADADGQGVAAALCQQDAPASSAAAGADRQQQQQQQQGGAANGHGGSNGSNGAAAPRGGRASPLFDFGAAYPGEASKERLRRASTSAAVWEQAQLEKQQQQQQHQADVQRPQGPGQPPAGPEQQQAQQGTAQQAQQGATQKQPPVRRRSMSDALRSRPRPQQPSPRLASSSSRGKFDASLPIEFGRYKGGGTGGTAKLAPAVARGSDLEDASYYGGDGTSTYGGSYHGEQCSQSMQAGCVWWQNGCRITKLAANFG